MKDAMKVKLSTRQVWVRGVIAAVLATITNVAIAALSARLVDASPDFPALQPGPVATFTLFTVLMGTAVFALLNRFTARPVRVFTIVASAVALVSLIAPIALAGDTSGTMAGVTPAAALALIPLHLVPAVVIIMALAWRRRGAEVRR